MTMFQVDCDKLRNYLWCCYEKQWCCRWGCKHTHKSFDLLKIWPTSLKIGAKMAPNVAWLQKMTPNISKRIRADILWRSHQKVHNDPCRKEFVGKSCTKTFLGCLGKFGQKSFATPKICLLLNLWWKGTSSPVAPLFKGLRDETQHASTFRRPCACCSAHTLFTRCCRLQFVTVMNINCQWHPNAEQFITAKIPDNALKQGVEHTQCYVSAVHNWKKVRLREFLVE